MTGVRPAKSRLVSRLVLIVSLSTTTACLFGPPINEPPEQYDTPPFVHTEDVYPESEKLHTVDRSTDTSTTLRVEAVSDYNLNDEIAYEFWVLTSALGPVRPARGTLRESLVQDNPNLTVYSEVRLELDVCTVELKNEDWTVVWLRLIDQIPTDQQDILGSSEYVVDIFWDIELLGLCP